MVFHEIILCPKEDPYALREITAGSAFMYRSTAQELNRF